MAENKSLTLSQAIEQPEIVARFTRTLGNNQNKAQAFLRSVMLATNGNPKLANANPMSILSSAMVAASLDLEINPNLGYAAIVPYDNKKAGVTTAQFQMMTNGLIQLFFRSGQAKALNPFIVYADEYNGFDKIRGELKPLNDHDEKCTEIVGYGCYIELTNGFAKTEFWSAEKVKNHALRYSQAFKNGYECPWKTNYNEMALKTVLKYTLTHYAPKTTSMQMALDADQSSVNLADDGTLSFDYVDNTVDVTPKGFSEDEKAEREALLLELANLPTPIPETEIVKNFKGAETIDDVSTSFLKQILAMEKS